jgi:cell division transport system permease protein
MKKFSLSFAFSKSFSQIGNTLVMSVATILALMGSLVMLGSVGLLQYTVEVNLADLSTQGQAAIFLQSDCTDDEILLVQGALDGYVQSGQLESYKFVSKEAALHEEMERFRDYPQLFHSLQTGENPYRDSFELDAGESGEIASVIEDLQKFALTRSSEEGGDVTFTPVASYALHDTATDTVQNVMSVIRNVGLVLFTALLMGGLFILINTVRLAIFGRSQELAVMRYVGATQEFIKAPFLMQGLVLGFFSSAAAFGVQWYLYEKCLAYVGNTFPLITLIPFEYLWYYVLAAFLFVGVLVGFVGGALSTACYLRDGYRFRS